MTWGTGMAETPGTNLPMVNRALLVTLMAIAIVGVLGAVAASGMSDAFSLMSEAADKYERSQRHYP